MILRHITLDEGQAVTEQCDRIVEARYDFNDKSFHILLRDEEAEEWQGLQSLRKKA
jgi:hypothetical protein